MTLKELREGLVGVLSRDKNGKVVSHKVIMKSDISSPSKPQHFFASNDMNTPHKTKEDAEAHFDKIAGVSV